MTDLITALELAQVCMERHMCWSLVTTRHRIHSEIVQDYQLYDTSDMTTTAMHFRH